MPTESIPPEDPSLRSQVRALSLQVEGLTRLLLGLESACRELLGEVRADRQARAAELARDAQLSPLSAAAVALLQALAADPVARSWVGRALALLVVAVVIAGLAHVDVAAASPLSGIFSLADHYLSPGKAP
jgi:hypothetical protein